MTSIHGGMAQHTHLDSAGEPLAHAIAVDSRHMWQGQRTKAELPCVTCVCCVLGARVWWMCDSCHLLV